MRQEKVCTTVWDVGKVRVRGEGEFRVARWMVWVVVPGSAAGARSGRHQSPVGRTSAHSAAATFLLQQDSSASSVFTRSCDAVRPLLAAV